jgi:hypothetical protein
VTSNNVIDLSAQRLVRQKAHTEELRSASKMETFLEGYCEASYEAMHIFNSTINSLKSEGFDDSYFDISDVKLLRETLFCIIMRYREQYHPLHSYSPEFDKYFSEIEKYLDEE